MADLIKKKKIREGHRSVTAKRLSEATKLLEEIEAGAVSDQVRLAQIRLTLSSKLETLKKLDDEVVDLITDGDEVVKEIEESDLFNEDVSNKLVQIDRHIRHKDAAVDSHESRAKLPKLNLPVFTGDIMEWMTFWDSYNAAVHSDSKLSDVEKFTYYFKNIS